MMGFFISFPRRDCSTVEEKENSRKTAHQQVKQGALGGAGWDGMRIHMAILVRVLDKGDNRDYNLI